jgi:hypothetical protein
MKIKLLLALTLSLTGCIDAVEVSLKQMQVASDKCKDNGGTKEIVVFDGGPFSDVAFSIKTQCKNNAIFNYRVNRGK